MARTGGERNGSRATILLVEDDPLQRLAAADEFREMGCDVVEAATADEALRLVRAGLCFDLLFTDVRTPGAIDGLALAATVRAERPSTPVVIASAHAPAAASRQLGNAFLRKPFSTSQAVALIERLLTQSEAEGEVGRAGGKAPRHDRR